MAFVHPYFCPYPFSKLSQEQIFSLVCHCDPLVGTEELAHMEIISAIVAQLTKNLSIDEIKKAGFDSYFVDHTVGIWPQSASGSAFTSAYFQSKGDPITDLHEDMAADGTTVQEQRG